MIRHYDTKLESVPIYPEHLICHLGSCGRTEE